MQQEHLTLLFLNFDLVIKQMNYLFFLSGLALECVQCNSFSTKDCDSNIEKYKLPCIEKFANATSCRKMEQEGTLHYCFSNNFILIK